MGSGAHLLLRPGCPSRGWQLDAAATPSPHPPQKKPNPTKTPRKQESSKEQSPAPQQALQKPDGTRSGTNPNPKRWMLQILNDPTEADQVPRSAPCVFRLCFGLDARALAAAPLIRRTGGREGERRRGRLKGNKVGSAGFPLLP